MNMDKPVRRVAIFGLLLFFALMAQVNYVQGSQADKLRNDPNNTRRFADVFNSPRGQIIAGGQVLAESQPTHKDNPKYGRTYKEGVVFSPVVGFFNGGAGKVELAYNSLLGGTDKRITHQRWFDAFIGKKPEGANVELALNTQAQRTAYRVLKGGTSRRAGAAVIDIKTGAVVVLASASTGTDFDPNEVAPQKGTEGGKRLVELDKAKGTIKPLIDNAMSQTFPPGSSFKIVTAALGMEDLGLDSSSNQNTGPLLLPESHQPLPNSHDGGSCAGSASLIDAFAESCNTSFGRLGLELGIDRLSEGAKRFGFGRKVRLEPDLYAATSDVPKETRDLSGKVTPTGQDGTARSGIGQENVRATPLQMAMVASAVANNGKIMQPYLVQRVRAKDQSELYSAQPKEFGQAIKPGTASQLRDMMRQVVSKGTATNLQGQNIAGKTGTAEQGGGNPNARWFVGFGPIENPRYAFAVITEGSGDGAHGAGPLAASIMAQVLKK
ncbi:peptidoglycan D,D-transpeptidase FtsI family protein [Actinomadura macrotermitis]|uniref:Penicillin-binding protein A n=1 Tax=Actinomadura macrotermitis TaxID=2585200 RepID=A0A7K0BVQ7_9ACTN|nr:penicillin-binding transpeptidase domain-containing protein [Actinomadura macrotermitis]MQY05156.1 Penicillin-binding protein A [Actinomadura macrotermitis]